MHIAFLTPEYPHVRVLHSAGIGTSIKNLAVALTQKGVKVSVFVYGQNEAVDFEEEGVKLHLIKAQKYKILGWYLHRKYIQNHLNTLIISEHIDLVEAPDWTGITAFMNLKVPLVIRFHGSDAYFCHLENRKQKLKNYWFEKLAIQKAKAFIAPTTFAGQLSQKIFNIKNKTIQTIHNGLDLHYFHNSNPENFEKTVILYIGTIIRKKGVLELPAIFNLVRQKHPGASLVLIGSDSFDITTQSQSTWELMQKEFKDNDFEKVFYLGKIPYQAVLEHLKEAHVCVFPTFAETLGMVTIEAMAMQKTVVNSNVGWAKEMIVDGESGYLVHPKDHELFANRINSVFENTDLMIKIGKNARERVKAKFDIEKIAIENIVFYKSLIV
ncbi:glycosyltransferase family 1 protein [Flavobacterium petrolei]|uniref:Glycosyltransferase family 1 protein n=1 Tax=Flavobacterium petrolei TaxID=2259594 RepID=A0A482TWH3_9FLAO|nr:glycosyltransferase family 4 protein [Flavobacterium petrolei]RYJ50890.1 glycosyltransferase family 1 protein [Flavobacterium petrolei]